MFESLGWIAMAAVERWLLKVGCWLLSCCSAGPGSAGPGVQRGLEYVVTGRTVQRDRRGPDGRCEAKQMSVPRVQITASEEQISVPRVRKTASEEQMSVPRVLIKASEKNFGAKNFGA